MSTVTRHQNRAAARRPGAALDGLAGRSRRADAGTVTEMARSLLRDAREVRGAEARRGPGPARLGRLERRAAAEPTAQAA